MAYDPSNPNPADADGFFPTSDGLIEGTVNKFMVLGTGARTPAEPVNTGTPDAGSGTVAADDQHTHPISSNWEKLQIFEGGAYIGGQADSDVAPEDVVLSGKGAFPGASTNLVGSNLVLGGGAGQSKFTVTDYANLYGGFVDIFLNKRLPSAIIYRMTEGIEFSAQASNDVTAANLAAAVNAWCPGVYAIATGAVVALEKAPAITNMRAESGTATITHANAAYGAGYLDGPWSLLQTLYQDGEVILPWAVVPCTGNFLNINATDKSFVVLSAAAAWQAAGVLGAKAGKLLLLGFQDTNITIPNSAPFSLASTYTSSVGGFLQLIYDGTVWREMWRK